MSTVTRAVRSSRIADWLCIISQLVDCVLSVSWLTVYYQSADWLCIISRLVDCVLSVSWLTVYYQSAGWLCIISQLVDSVLSVSWLTVKTIIVYCETGEVCNSSVLSEVDNVSQLASSWTIKQVVEELLYYQHISDNWSIDGETYSSHSQSLCKESWVSQTDGSQIGPSMAGWCWFAVWCQSVCLSVTRW